MLIRESTAQGATWPAIPDAAGSLMLALQYQLAASGRLGPEVLGALQRRQLVRVLRHA